MGSTRMMPSVGYHECRDVIVHPGVIDVAGELADFLTFILRFADTAPGPAAMRGGVRAATMRHVKGKLLCAFLSFFFPRWIGLLG